MGISYELAEDVQQRVNEIARMLFPHVRLDSVVCLRSYGSSSRGTIARCHALGKAMQIALGRKGFYVIEVLSKRFDKMPYDEQTKTLIHELMHIPKSFGGGFIHHNIVHSRNVETMYQHYCNVRNSNRISDHPEIPLQTKQGFPNMKNGNIDKSENTIYLVKKRRWF